MELSIAIIGAGGLGVTAAWELLSCLEYDYEIKIYDSDKIELSNLNRQILFTKSELGRNKALVLAEKLSEKFPKKKIIAKQISINLNNIHSELINCCAVIDATDSARTSFLLNDYCVNNLKLFSYAGVVGNYGQTILVNPAFNTPCLRCVFGNWDEKEFLEIEHTCQAAGIIGPIAGYLGALQAQELIQALELKFNKGHLTKVSIKNLAPKEIEISKSLHCVNKCKEKNILEVNLTEKTCPQTFILSKLALEQANSCTTLLFSFKTKENALKTSNSLKEESKIANWIGTNNTKFIVASCN